MKSNKVRMNISRDMHDWFTAIDGNTNDERMQRIIDEFDRKAKREMELSRELSMCYDEIDSAGRFKEHEMRNIASIRKENKELKLKLSNSNFLVLCSTCVAIISVSYLAYAQGWFL